MYSVMGIKTSHMIISFTHVYFICESNYSSSSFSFNHNYYQYHTVQEIYFKIICS